MASEDLACDHADGCCRLDVGLSCDSPQPRRIPMRHVADGGSFALDCGCAYKNASPREDGRPGVDYIVGCDGRDGSASFESVVYRHWKAATGSTLVTLISGDVRPPCDVAGCGCREERQTTARAPEPLCIHGVAWDRCLMPRCDGPPSKPVPKPALRHASGTAHGFTWQSIEPLPEACAKACEARVGGEWLACDLRTLAQCGGICNCMPNLGGCGFHHELTAKRAEAHAPKPAVEKRLARGGGDRPWESVEALVTGCVAALERAVVCVSNASGVDEVKCANCGFVHVVRYITPPEPASLPESWEPGQRVPERFVGRGFVIPDEPFALDVTALRHGALADSRAMGSRWNNLDMKPLEARVAEHSMWTPERRPYERARRTR